MMKIFAVFCALFVAAYAAGEFKPINGINDELTAIARWASSQLSGYTGIDGEHNILSVKNAQVQVVAGMNYKFTLELLVAGPENKYYFRNCDLVVFDQPWTKTRTLTSVKCQKSPTSPDF